MQPTSLQDSLALAPGPCDFCWQNSGTVCAPGCPPWLLLRPWALCLQPTFQGELAVMLVSLTAGAVTSGHQQLRGGLTASAPGQTDRHRERCCPSPYKLPLLRSQRQWSQVGFWSLCQQPWGLYPASFLSHFPLLMCWHGANSKWAQVHRATSLTSPGEGQKTRSDIVSNLYIMKRPFMFFPESC